MEWILTKNGPQESPKASIQKVRQAAARARFKEKNKDEWKKTRTDSFLMRAKCEWEQLSQWCSRWGLAHFLWKSGPRPQREQHSVRREDQIFNFRMSPRLEGEQENTFCYKVGMGRTFCSMIFLMKMRFALKWPREAQNAPSETWISRRKMKKKTPENEKCVKLEWEQHAFFWCSHGGFTDFCQKVALSH